MYCKRREECEDNAHIRGFHWHDFGDAALQKEFVELITPLRKDQDTDPAIRTLVVRYLDNHGAAARNQ